MKSSETFEKPRLKNRSLRWMMRVVGFSLASASVAVLTRDLSTRKGLELLCGAGSVIGAVTMASSWVPGRKNWPESDDENLFV